MDRRMIEVRLKRLEKAFTNVLPIVNAKYQNGAMKRFYGTPPIEDLLSIDNPIIETSGSQFADLINAILHPLSNRNIDELELPEERKDDEKGKDQGNNT